MKEAIFIILIIVAILISLVVRRSEERKIKERIESLGVEVVNIEYRKFFRGPFVVLNKLSSVYRFEYNQDCPFLDKTDTPELEYLRFSQFFADS